MRGVGFGRRWLPLAAATAFGAVLAGGCAMPPPKEIHAGALGVIPASPPQRGTYQEGASVEWLKFVVTAAFDGYSDPDQVPGWQALPKHKVRAQLHRLMASRSGALWIGHSTFLIKTGGMVVLTDPVFSERASLSQTMGPKRYFPPALEIDELPCVDVIVISHNHYDHLDTHSLKALAERFPKARVLVPVGNEKYAARSGFTHVRGFAPGQGAKVAGLKFLATPAYHQTSRKGIDAHMTPALGWSIRGGAASIFFAGDTAYGPVFRQIRHTYGAHDVALVPIGTYEPPDEVKHVHATPEEAARIASDLGAGVAVAMHWGTFPLSEEPFLEPAQRFLKAHSPVARRVLPLGGAIVFRHGAPMVTSEASPRDAAAAL
jgi:L-ascorbate metabolism protein UlaG (beta-lactamase superfamily)